MPLQEDILKCKTYFSGRFYWLETYGCQMNAHDSEQIAGLLREIGMLPAQGREDADFILFNTCCVREGAEERVYGNLGRLRALKEKKPGLLIGLCGCMPKEQGVPEAIKKRFPFVDILFGNRNQYLLPGMLLKAATEQKAVYAPHLGEGEGAEHSLPAWRENTFTAYITIMHGCNNYCAYCIVPYVRGREQSRRQEDILAEAHALALEGCKQIILLGQNVNSYGMDNGQPAFPALLRALNEIMGIERISFMTSHPKDLSDALIAAMAECGHVSKYLHLPVQSGSDTILQKMNRRYTRGDYLLLVEKLRKSMPGIGLTTDIIVGFPGETEEDFSQTLSLCEEVCFAGAYTFLYSPRTGTPAAKMPLQVPAEVAKERLTRLLALQKACTEKVQKAYVGNTYPVLAEAVSKRAKSMLTGRTDCGRTVNFTGGNELLGNIVPVQITGIKANTLFGELRKEVPLG